MSQRDRNAKNTAVSDRPKRSQRVECSRDVRRKWGRQIELTLGNRVSKPQPMSMEGLAVDQGDGVVFVARCKSFMAA